MANGLDKITPKAPAAQRAQLPVKVGGFPVPQLPLLFKTGAKLPQASIVYGMAASALFVIALFFLFSGHWFTAFLVLLPAVCFLGYALHFLKQAP